MEPVEIADNKCTSTEEGVIILDIPRNTAEPNLNVSEFQTVYLIDWNEFLTLTLVDQSNTQSNSMEEEKKQQLSSFINISTLRTLNLVKEISIIVEYDEGGYLARSVDFPLYAEGDDSVEAIENLKNEIEILFYELQEDDNFSEEWLNYKRFLNNIIDH